MGVPFVFRSTPSASSPVEAAEPSVGEEAETNDEWEKEREKKNKRQYCHLVLSHCFAEPGDTNMEIRRKEKGMTQLLFWNSARHEVSPLQVHNTSHTTATYHTQPMQKTSVHGRSRSTNVRAVVDIVPSTCFFLFGCIDVEEKGCNEVKDEKWSSWSHFFWLIADSSMNSNL